MYKNVWAGLAGHSEVFEEEKSGVGSGSAFRVQVGFGDQHFGDVPFEFSGFFKVKFRIGWSGLVRVLIIRVRSGSGIKLSGKSPSGFGVLSTSLILARQ